MNNKIFNTKNEGINILKEYFKKFNSNELGYYLEKSQTTPIDEFFNLNVYCPEDIELTNLFLRHFIIVIKKIFNDELKTEFIEKSIKISFITNSIYWQDVFVINNTIFIKYQYLINIFENIEYNKYTTMNDIYMNDGKIYDIGLLKNIIQSFFSILQNLYPENLLEYLFNEYNCVMVDIDNIKFKSNYKILKEPNINLTHRKIPIYSIDDDDDNIYTCFNSICSNDNLFSPYWEEKIIKLKYIDGIYIEIEEIFIDKFENKKNLIISPIENILLEITDKIISSFI